MKAKPTYSASDMGIEIKNLEIKYHEYFALKKKFNKLYYFIITYLLITMAICLTNIINNFIYYLP